MHQKALEVLAEVFSIIGETGLAGDLPVYLPGLAHTLSFVNLSTRPLVLQLFDNHILQLPLQALRPALKALILSLLPVIEDQTSEDFEKCLRTFDALRTRFAQDGQESFFWQTLFVASIANSHRRAGVLVYATRYLPKLTNLSKDGDLSSIIVTPEPGLLVRCFATGLCDSDTLVQRDFLDLLVTHLPLNASILQNAIYSKDLDVLVKAAMTIVLRRDMGLNRRLWAWFTGNDDKAQESGMISPVELRQLELHNDYFMRFGCPSTIRAIESMLQSSPAYVPSITTPFRIMLSLLDRWEIGGPVVKACFQPLMTSLMQYRSTAPTQSAFDDAFRSANVFFDAIESLTTFTCLADLLRQNELELLSFVIASFGIELADRVHVHAAKLCTNVLDILQTEDADQHSLCDLLNALTVLISPTAFEDPQEGDEQVAGKLLHQLAEVVTENFKVKPFAIITSQLCTSLERAILFTPSLKPLEELDLIYKSNAQYERDSGHDLNTWPQLEATSRIVMSLLTRLANLEDLMQSSLFEVVPRLTASLWVYLATNTPQYHVSTVETLWRLHELTPDDGIVESTILQMLDMTDRKACIEQFGVFYHHTKTVRKAMDDTIPDLLARPVLRILDTARDQDRNDPHTQWLLSSHVISLLLRRTLQTSEDQQQTSLALQRTRKLVRISRLADKHWLAFIRSTELSLVLAFCLKMIEDESALRPQAFELLRALYEHETSNITPDELVLFLVDKLGSIDAQLQEEVLDTMLAVLNDSVSIPPALVDTLLQGLSILPMDERLDKWTTLLCNVLPNQGSLIPNLLKTTSAFCRRIDEAFEDLQSLYSHGQSQGRARNSDKTISNLLSGLEFVIARAHQKVFHDTLSNGHLSNGTSDEGISSRALANHKLTVILCMQDVVRVCARQWLWKSRPRTEVPDDTTGDAKSFQYSSTKARARSRKTLENMIEVEPQECLETLIGMFIVENDNTILDLLQTLNSARPRVMLPIIFTAIERRTNASITVTKAKSTVSVQINTHDLVNFLNRYTNALEDDMLEEIWPRCAAYSREVLANPMPHRQILIKLLNFCSIIARKMDNTSFSEDNRMHRELADLCTRLFTAIFTIKPSGFDSVVSVDPSRNSIESHSPQDTLLSTLVETLPHLNALLSQSGRLAGVYSGIATNVTAPALHSRVFPQNITLELLEVIQIMSTTADASKSLKKDLLDCLNNPRIFRISKDMARKGWLPILRQLQVADKAILPDCLSRLTAPGAAGVVLGLGAAAARVEADRRTQLELRRITSLIMAAGDDAVLPHLKLTMQKIEELLTATSESSPSLATRGDLYLLLRAVLLNVSEEHLTTFRPILNTELQLLCKDILAGIDSRYTPYSKLQGAKLLDHLLLLRPDEFQLHEWLFVTDTIDAIYPHTTTKSIAYADEIGHALTADVHFEPLTPAASDRKTRKPWLCGRTSESIDSGEVNTLLSGFFGQLSIRAFEDLYGLQPIDEVAVAEDVLADLFTDSSQ